MVLLYDWKRWRIVANADNLHHKQKKWSSKYYPIKYPYDWISGLFIHYFYSFIRVSKYSRAIVGKGGHIPPPFLRFPLSTNPRCPTFYRSIMKTKVLNDFFNQFVYKFYPQSILILGEYLLKWWNANLI